MAHHRRHRRKKARAGCLFCKPHKCNGVRNGDSAQRRQGLLGRLSEREQRREALSEQARSARGR